MTSPPPEPVEQLLSVAQALMSAQDADEVLQRVTEVALRLFRVEACSLSLFDATTRELVFFLSQGQASVKPFRMSVDKGIAGHVFRSGEMFLSNAVAEDSRFFPGVDQHSGHTTRSMICCPMGRAGERTGTIQVLNTSAEGGFTSAQGKLLGVLASMAGAALDRARTEREVRDSHQVLRDENAGRHSLVEGEAPAMHDALGVLRKAARSKVTVLLLGESGVGKEVAARAVHNWSARADRPMVAINCAALSPSLLESELFGHEKGAFTGAASRKRGKFELADGGTLFLDEVGELAPELQTKLLRVLQEGEFNRVGGNDAVRSDVRVIAATNRDLKRAVDEGQFRLDLYYRLNVISVTLPPLRERPEDIERLAHHFLSKACAEQKRVLKGFDQTAMDRLRAYAWPGNVRELANIVERAVVLSAGSAITVGDLPQEVSEAGTGVSTSGPKVSGDDSRPMHECVADFKRELIVSALTLCDGNQARAADRLGLHPSNLSRTIRQLGLR